MVRAGDNERSWVPLRSRRALRETGVASPSSLSCRKETVRGVPFVRAVRSANSRLSARDAVAYRAYCRAVAPTQQKAAAHLVCNDNHVTGRLSRKPPRESSKGGTPSSVLVFFAIFARGCRKPFGLVLTEGRYPKEPAAFLCDLGVLCARKLFSSGRIAGPGPGAPSLPLCPIPSLRSRVPRPPVPHTPFAAPRRPPDV